MKLSLHHFELPLKHEFRISREAISVQPTLIVELEADGIRGFGEATTNSYYGVTLDSMITALRKVRDVIESYSPDDPEGLWDELSGPLGGDAFALCAVDQAAHDLCGKLIGQPLYRLWGLESRPRPPQILRWASTPLT